MVRLVKTLFLEKFKRVFMLGVSMSCEYSSVRSVACVSVKFYYL